MIGGIRTSIASVLAALMVLAVMTAPNAASAEPSTVAFLGVRFMNDNEGLEPTTDAERARIEKIAKLFTSKLAASGKYALVDVPPTVEVKIAKGQPIGECGGCEIAIGKELGADQIAWITVQKVSNLILNMNVYMANVDTAQMTFVRSVDIRGNTDQTWTRSLNYLLKNYLLKDDAS